MPSFARLLKSSSFDGSGKGKSRVYVALYTLQGISHLPEVRAAHGLTGFHWGIFVIPKGRNIGTLHEVQSEPTYVNIPGSGGWRYGYHQGIEAFEQRAMLGLIMVGKLSTGHTSDGVDEMLSQIPVPVEDMVPRQSCVSWTKEAMNALQKRGWVEDFNVDEFVEWSVTMGDKWLSDGPDKPWINYTQRKTGWIH